ncbi:MAG: hypothetical protein HZA93_28480 [Verrucomicrobia bacterium]|nr:hypothetical protein [Verrucomicrobiota bacterium]
MAPYTWRLDRSALVTFEGLPLNERRQIREFLDSLGRHPFHDGHLRYRDADGFEIRVCVAVDLNVHYHLDHAERVIRITGLERPSFLES